MSEVNTGDGEGKKGKPKKLQTRVDFTPMVDMNMLLITFFMFCTTLSKPQMMDLVMPTKDKDITVEQQTKVDEAKTITLLLAENDIIYYYFGKPNYEDYTSLIKTDYTPNGLRAMLVGKNGKAIAKMAELRDLKQQNKIPEEQYKEQAKEIRGAKDGIVVIIKPTNASTYKNLVDVLDEMQICSIGQYAIVDLTDGDTFLIENLMKKGALTQQAAKFKQS
ncbi:MAG: biopolymer transporter ExbD [Bacteroidales bacterium]